MTELTDEQKAAEAAVRAVGQSGGAGLMASVGTPWAAVVFKPPTTWAYPAPTREAAEELARSIATSSVEAVKVGVFEARSWATVETSVRFEGMGDAERTPVDRPGPSEAFKQFVAQGSGRPAGSR